jgi:hypothetical protein
MDRGWKQLALVACLLVVIDLWITRAMANLAWWHAVLLSAAAATQLLPTLAVVALEPPRPPARVWIGVWGFAFFLSDLLQLIVAQLTGGNLWFLAVANPIEDAALLWALAYWQTRPVMRLAFRAAIPVLALSTLGIAWYFGELGGFKAVSSPFRLLVLTTAIAYTVVHRSLRETESTRNLDWFWTCLGVLLYYAAYVIVDPVSQALMPERMELARLVYVVKAASDTIAFILVWKGMRCPRETVSSTSMLEPYSRSG